MPNRFNINAPVTLLANGRSGTSLIQGVFANHPDFDTCGETAPLLFGVWQSTERLKGIVRPDHDLGKEADFDLRCGKAVRAAFITTFRAPKKKFWMHKPIGVPWVWGQLLNGGKTPDEAADWYWRAVNMSFPDAQTITVLRHPYDVVLSAMEYWHISATAAWDSIVRMAHILGHPDSSIKHAIDFSALVADPAGEVFKLFDATDRPFHTDCLNAFEKLWVQQQNRKPDPISAAGNKSDTGFSRRENWGDLDTSSFSQDDHDVLVAMWAKYGVELTF